jgi:tripartite-type tricarboxylate transporter receptor subunit TctC
MLKRRLVLALAAAAFTAGAMAADAFPAKPIRMVVGFAAGGAADVITRVVAQALGKQLGQQVIVDNRPGAASSAAPAANAWRRVVILVSIVYSLFLTSTAPCAGGPTLRR